MGAKKEKIGAVLVLGGGIGGIQASLDLAESGYKVYLVEKSPAIGGVMAQLDKTFPTNDCSICILSPKLVECGRHLNIELITYSEVLGVKGEPGDFTVSIRKKARLVNEPQCTGCGLCAEGCPIVMKSEFDQGLGERKAIYTPYPQAVPAAYAIDKREERPCHAACKGACPIHMNVQGYLALIAEERFKEAYELIRRTNPLPAICGRVCYAPCEDACNRGQLDEPVSSRALKRFIADQIDIESLEVPRITKNGKKVAIIGSGPAGLAAAHDLALKGYNATIFEAFPEPGGMLRYGIPEYRLPKDILRKEIGYIEKLGVKIRTNKKIGEAIKLKELRKDYQAIFIATGAHESLKLNIPGEDSPGVIHAVDFLRKANMGEIVDVGKKVVVIGGGNTAIDASRVARRFGADVKIIYRRSRAEMPATAEEVKAAEGEGVEITFLANPTRIITENGKVSKIECIRMELGKPDESGRRRPIPIEGSEFIIDVDWVIPALGQASDIEFAKEAGLEITRKGTITTNESTLATNIEGIFAGGDVVTGPAVVIEAIAAGKKAACSIDEYLKGKPLTSKEDRKAPQKLSEGEIISLKEHFPSQNRIKAKELETVTRTESFEEVEKVYSTSEAQKEARRCLASQIEGCFECYECEERCEAKAIDHKMEDKYIDIKVGSIILAPGFNKYEPWALANYGYGKYPNVVTSIEFERILSASGPYQGKLLRPSDKKPPQKIAWLQCVGSRDESIGAGYCASVCCTYAIKEAIVAKEHVSTPLETSIFFIDIRAHGKDFERYHERAKEEYGVRFIRSRVHTIFQDSDECLILRFADYRGIREERFDMVVLSVGIRPPAANKELSERLGLELNQHGFCQVGDFSPVATSKPGVFAAGAFTGPKDIPETVMEASAASNDASILLSPARHSLTLEKQYPPEKDVIGEKPRIGVFICHCGINIGGIVGVPSVKEYAATLPNVVFADENLFTCSQDTQQRIKEKIDEYNLNRVVVASCTPRTHEPLFQETLREAGLNKYLFEMANIRDQCSWVHMNEPEKATEKAKDLVKMTVAKARLLEPLKETPLEVKHSALVVGAGISGMRSALSLAEQGFEVHLVERSSQLGGIANRIRHTLEGLDVQTYLRELVDKVSQESLINVYKETDILEVGGYVGNFRAKLLVRPEGEVREIDYGAAIIATGGEVCRPKEYLYGEHSGVFTTLELEEEIAKGNSRVCSSQNVVFIQCVGSREKERPYCSRVCCGETVKLALKLKEMNPEVNIYVLYRDIRTYGFEEQYYQEARAKGVLFIPYDESDKPEVQAVNKDILRISVNEPILEEQFSIDADVLALATATLPSSSNEELARLFKVPLNEDGFFLEAHVKLRPVDFSTEGVFVCGLGHAPKHIDESIVQAKAAASRAATILSRESVKAGGIVCTADKRKCTGCGMCAEVCPFGAIEIDAKEKTAVVNEALCKGCGVCASSCRSGALDIKGFSDKEILSMIKAS